MTCEHVDRNVYHVVPTSTHGAVFRTLFRIQTLLSNLFPTFEQQDQPPAPDFIPSTRLETFFFLTTFLRYERQHESNARNGISHGHAVGGNRQPLDMMSRHSIFGLAAIVKMAYNAVRD